MTRQRLFLAAVLAGLAALSAVSPPVWAQSRGDVIAPPPTKSDGSVITPPAAHADPGIEKAKPPEQSQLPEGRDKTGREDSPVPKMEKDR